MLIEFICFLSITLYVVYYYHKILIYKLIIILHLTPEFYKKLANKKLA